MWLGTEPGLTRRGRTSGAPAEDASGRRRRRRAQVHLSFAATGDPGWTRYDPHQRNTRVYDAECTIARYPEEQSRRIWRGRRFGVLDVT